MAGVDSNPDCGDICPNLGAFDFIEVVRASQRYIFKADTQAMRSDSISPVAGTPFRNAETQVPPASEDDEETGRQQDVRWYVKVSEPHEQLRYSAYLPQASSRTR